MPLADNGNGYVYIRARPIRIGVHVLSFLAFKGGLEDGAYVLHRCDNPPCWNPAHLFAGSQAINMLDKQVKGRAIGPQLNGASNPAAKLTVEAVQAIRASQQKQCDLAMAYGVSKSLVSAIKRREVWASP